MSHVDDLVIRISSSVLDPESVRSLLVPLVEDARGAWTQEAFSEITGVSPIVELIFNSAFVRAAARAGCVFYLGSDGKIYRQAVRGPRPTLSSGATALDSAGSDYFVEPPWYDHLKMFIEEGAPTLLIGPPGVGKTEACERLFQGRRQELHIVSCSPAMTADDLEGRIELRNDAGVVVTRFEPGELAIASRDGNAILLDEADAIPPHAAFGVFRLLAGKDMRILRMGTDGRIPRHDDFRIVGTQNTEGRGDDKGLHHGRAYQDEAFLDRWENVIRVDYLDKHIEVDILVKKTGIEQKDAESIVEGATLLRRSLAEDAIMFCCSMRRTLAVAKNLVRGFDVVHAWNYAVMNRATREDAKNMIEILERVYGSFPGGKKKRRSRR